MNLWRPKMCVPSCYTPHVARNRRFFINDKNLCYLVYRYKGQIKVKKGYDGRRVFYPASNVSVYQTGIPEEYMKVSSKGKVLVKDENDIPKAIQILKDHYSKKLDDVEHANGAAFSNTVSVINQEGWVIE